MLAGIYYGPGDIRVEQTDEPVLQPGDALIRVRAAAICGSDLSAWRQARYDVDPTSRRILGHELCGEIAAVAGNETRLRAGMRVGVAPIVPCGQCDPCQRGQTNLCERHEVIGLSMDGGFAEYARVPARGVHQGCILPLPEGLDDEQAALLEPLADCYSGLLACRFSPGGSVFIAGAGPMGMMHLLTVRAAGAGPVVVSEPDAERRQMARELGADLVLDPRHDDIDAAVMALTRGRGVDMAIVCAAQPPLYEQCVRLLARGGAANFFAGVAREAGDMRISAHDVHYREIMITGTSGTRRPNMLAAMQLLVAGRVNLRPLVSRVFPLADLSAAFAFAASGQAMKVLVKP